MPLPGVMHRNSCVTNQIRGEKEEWMKKQDLQQIWSAG